MRKYEHSNSSLRDPSPIELTNVTRLDRGSLSFELSADNGDKLACTICFEIQHLSIVFEVPRQLSSTVVLRPASDSPAGTRMYAVEDLATSQDLSVASMKDGPVRFVLQVSGIGWVYVELQDSSDLS
ncbi:hypothetical protein ACCO45_004463 [Purpureocillium lilacinum]|uniref:Uncharacterized protein n=1 Tax=Purpureocillium lilacinum TaxID=33203 RepID=A0ACC4E2S1_PURLI